MINDLPKSLIEAANKILTKSEHPMIDVDGEMKHCHNSEGNPIHDTVEGIRNFHRWFANSTVTDDHGRPLVVYHGSQTGNINEFNPKHIGSRYGYDTAGFFFTDNKRTARGYAFTNDQKTDRVKRLSPEGKADADSRITTVYLSLKNPITNKKLVGHKDFLQAEYHDPVDLYDSNRKPINDLIDFHDGVHLKRSGEQLLVATHPTQIKSVHGNNGYFHREKNNIMESSNGINHHGVLLSQWIADGSKWIDDPDDKTLTPESAVSGMHSRIRDYSKNYPSYNVDSNDYELRNVPLHQIKIKHQSHFDEDSSRNTANEIIKSTSHLDLYRKHDIMPILLGSDMSILDGHHRFNAAKFNNEKTIPALVPVSKGSGKVLNAHDYAMEMNKKTLKESIITEAKETRIPFADISHHHHKKHLNEGKIEDWINHQQPYDNQVNNFNFDTSIDSIRPNTYSTEDTHKDLADDHISNLDGHHRESIESYIMGGLEDGDETGSFKVNDHLIKSHKAKKEPKKEFNFGTDRDFQRYLNLDHLDDALSVNKLEKPLTTYAGIGFNPMDIMKEGNTLHLPAYTSSSTNRGVAVLYAKPDKDRVYHVMKINHPTGSTGLYIGDRNDFSPFMQKEHIMPRNTTLKINPKPEVHTDNLGVHLHIWKATRINTEDTK